MADTPKADIIVSNAPALSATSDMPTLPDPKPDTPLPAASQSADAAAATEGDGGEQQPAPSEGDGNAAAEAAGEEGGAQPQPKPKKDGISKRFSELTAERNEAEAARKAADDRATKLADSLETALETINKLGSTKAADDIKAAGQADPRPARDKFEDPTAYDDALIEWSARQATRVATAELEKRAAEQRQVDDDARKADDQKKAEEQQREQMEALQRSWGDKRTKALEAMPDYEEVAERDDLQISVPMAHTIMTAENGPQIAYHLGKNPKEAERIAALQPAQQVFEMGRLAAELARPKPNVSKAPDPITPTGSSREAAATKSREEMSGDEYYESRQAEKRARAN